MAQSTITPNETARRLSTALKRTITPKGVRTMARSIIARFDKVKHPEYQPHAYSAGEVKVLQAAFAARTGRAKAQPVRKARVRKAAASKAPSAPVES